MCQELLQTTPIQLAFAQHLKRQLTCWSQGYCAAQNLFQSDQPCFGRGSEHSTRKQRRQGWTGPPCRSLTPGLSFREQRRSRSLPAPPGHPFLSLSSLSLLEEWGPGRWATDGQTSDCCAGLWSWQSRRGVACGRLQWRSFLQRDPQSTATVSLRSGSLPLALRCPALNLCILW